MNKKKVVGFMKRHKTKLIVAGTVISSVVIYAICKRGSNNEFVKMPGFTIEGDLTVGDLGKLGEEFMKHDAELKADTPVLDIGHFRFG